tara:strand:+ start:51340 stop:51789 length:450 start_codon:yes stop_codon:yes gene_type:complete
MSSLKKLLQKKNYLKINLKKMVTKHLELDAEINGIKGRFILDTGASNSCVGIDMIDFFKIHAEVSDTKAAGAGAIDMETQKSEYNTLKIGKWKTNKFHLVLFDLTHVNSALIQHKASEVHGIIGADILEKGNAIIDYNKHILYLRKSKK